jgi:hypothetical protein
MAVGTPFRPVKPGADRALGREEPGRTFPSVDQMAGAARRDKMSR